MNVKKYGIILKIGGDISLKIKLKMDTRTLQDVAMELTAHERECAVYRDMTKMSLDKLEGRIKRLEVLIMGSTISTISLVIVVIMKIV